MKSEIIYMVHNIELGWKLSKNDKKHNSILTSGIQTRHWLIRKTDIYDSLKQGGVMSVIEYVTLTDEIVKECKQRKLEYKTEANISLD